MDDAFSVFEALRYNRDYERQCREDVSVAQFPREDDVIAELRYEVDKAVWAALVTRESERDGRPGFRLWYKQNDRYQRSALFPDGARLAGYIRQAAQEKFKTLKPVLDTLGRIEHKSAVSVIPDCFQRHARMDRCLKCPYESACFPPGETPVFAQGSQFAKHWEDAPKDDEPENVFLDRLRKKIEGRWGKDLRVEKAFKGSKKADRVFSLNKVNRVCPVCGYPRRRCVCATGGK